MPVLDVQKVKPQLEELLTRLIAAARFDLKFQVSPEKDHSADTESPDLIVNFSGADTDLLLSHGGELLDALEDLAVRVLRLDTAERGKISFDCGDYRSLRVYELRLTAETAAEKVLSSGAPFSLNPMNSRDRRIIHLTLQGNSAVRTESQGFGPQRKVVIFPAEDKPPSKK